MTSAVVPVVPWSMASTARGMGVSFVLKILARIGGNANLPGHREDRCEPQRRKGRKAIAPSQKRPQRRRGRADRSRRAKFDSVHPQICDGLRCLSASGYFRAMPCDLGVFAVQLYDATSRRIAACFRPSQNPTPIHAPASGIAAKAIPVIPRPSQPMAA